MSEDKPRILVTGSRQWSFEPTIAYSLDAAWRQLRRRTQEPITLVSGSCPSGADYLAEAIWSRNFGPNPIERHPADWNRHGKAAGPFRNAEMVKLGADICLAFIVNESPGASHTLRIAREAGIPVRVWRYDDR